MQSRPVLAIFSANQGHASLAAAVRSVAETEFEVVELQQTIKLENAYKSFYRFVPQLFGFFYYLSFNAVIVRLSLWWLYRVDHKAVDVFLQENRPSVAVCTYFGFLPSLEVQTVVPHLPIINLLANPRTTHPTEVAPPPVLNVIFDEHQADFCKKINQHSQNKALGWLVRPEFYPVTDQNLAKKSLHLDPHKLTITLIGGSEGNHEMVRLARTLINNYAQKVQVVVICGNNSVLKQLLTGWHLTLSAQKKAALHIVGFTTELHRYFQSSNIIIGKAGPNTLFESAACEVPFVAITHISGQEDGNLSLIKELGIGEVLEKRSALLAYLDAVISNPEKLATYQPALKNVRARLTATQQAFLAQLRAVTAKHQV